MNGHALSLILLTLNAGGPRRASGNWPARRDAIAAELREQSSAVAAFQELWRLEDVDALAAAAGHPHLAADPALGVAVTSRLPLDSWSSRDLGDGGAALRARLKTPKGDFDAYSARLSPEAKKAIRLGQMFRLAEFVRAQSPNRPFILLGDLAEGSEERESTLLLDLLEARDLCVSHGDEVCGRTLGEQRVDYALIPYSSRQPRELSRAAFTQVPADVKDDQPTPAHFGLRAALDPSFFRLRVAAAPAGRQEALSAIAEEVDAARLDAESRSLKVGWIPFWGTWQSLTVRSEASGLAALGEEIQTARILLPAKRSSSDGQ